jgi:type II secretory pathway pseudopilin PulG
MKLFRKLRQTLLSKGKTKEYLKYALGEIVLVVIGILVALQLNNWNTEMDNREKEQLYLNNLKLDLQNQILEIDEQIESEQRFMSHGKEILDAFNEDSTFFFDAALLEAANGLQDRRTFKTINPTYSELINTGEMKLIREEAIKRQLVTYYQDIERTKEVIKLNNSYFVDSETAPKLRRLIPSYWADPEDYSKKMTKELRYQGGISQEKMDFLISIAQSKLKEQGNLLEFINMATTRYDYAWFHVQIMLAKKRETMQLLEKLNSLTKVE